ncbi:hypothetical protein BGZ70_005676, partial [Mortierella alpina]
MILVPDESEAVDMDVEESSVEHAADMELDEDADNGEDDKDDDDDDGDVAWVPDDEDDEQIADEFDGYYQIQDKDIEELEKDDEQGSADDTVLAESSGAQIRRLFTVVKILVHSPHIRRDVTAEDVKRALLKNMTITDRELTVVRDLVNTLRPYAPKRVVTAAGSYRDHTGHVATCSPMVIISQAFLDAIDLHTFKRRICPQSSAGSPISLQMSSVVIYELFGTEHAGKYDIYGPAGSVITSAVDAATPVNKEA